MLTIASPLGPLRLLARGGHLVGLYLPAQLAPRESPSREPVLERAARQLAGYFVGELTAFDLPLAPQGTPFQRDVWRQLEHIPFGETRTYQMLAHALDRPTGARAVGSANGANPISIIVPCHRVIAGTGALTGYAGGIAAKAVAARARAARNNVVEVGAVPGAPNEVARFPIVSCESRG